MSVNQNCKGNICRKYIIIILYSVSKAMRASFDSLCSNTPVIAVLNSNMILAWDNWQKPSLRAGSLCTRHFPPPGTSGATALWSSSSESFPVKHLTFKTSGVGGGFRETCVHGRRILSASRIHQTLVILPTPYCFIPIPHFCPMLAEREASQRISII